MKKYYKYLPWIPIVGFFAMIAVLLFTNDARLLELNMDKPFKYWSTLMINTIAFGILMLMAMGYPLQC